MQDKNHAGPSAGGHGIRLLPCTLSATAILLSLCAFFVVSSFVLTYLYPTPQPKTGATSIQTIVIQTAAAEVAQTVIANFQSRPPAAPGACTATATLIPYATTTQRIYVRPTLEDIPGRPDRIRDDRQAPAARPVRLGPARRAGLDAARRNP